MSTKYLYRCPKCKVVLCNPETQGEYTDHGVLDVWCPVCKEWREAELIDTI